MNTGGTREWPEDHEYPSNPGRVRGYEWGGRGTDAGHYPLYPYTSARHSYSLTRPPPGSTPRGPP